MGTALGFEVSQVKALQKDEGDEQGQNEIQDGGGFVFKAVIEGPVGSQGMKQIILNLPPAHGRFAKEGESRVGRPVRSSPTPNDEFPSSGSSPLRDDVGG